MQKSFLVYYAFRNILNQDKKKLLFFTDSRGFEIGNTFTYKNGYGNVLYKYLINNFNLSLDINNFKHTTYLDFLNKYTVKDLINYDYIFLILGVVDFSPRKSLDACVIRKTKSASMGIKNESPITDSNFVYEGENTDCIITEELRDHILNVLDPLSDKIIVVTTNPVDNNWRGSYWKDRPKNMNSYLIHEVAFSKKLTSKYIQFPSSIDVSEYTVDNIHYNKFGFEHITKELNNIICKDSVDIDLM